MNIEEELLFEPLAARMRPKTLEEFIGQEHLLGENKPLNKLISTGKLHSMILWGSPGTGKTTLAKLLAAKSNAHIEIISAVLAGVKDIRAVVEKAKELQQEGKKTLLFVDEVHRFNKAQQDAFLPFVENGLLTLIGATTENPSFELNNALLSRARVYILKPLTKDHILKIICQALEHKEKGYGKCTINFKEEDKEKIAVFADGDARRALNLLEIVMNLAEDSEGHYHITEDSIHQALNTKIRQFDKGGDIFHEQISALHKSVRGSSPDAALYWMARMLDGGCDPLYIARRIVRMATEDIGNADPRALEIALNAWDTVERLGEPEGPLALAQAVIYMAVAAKSNAVYTAFNAVMSDVKLLGNDPVPIHLRNAPTKLLKGLGFGKAYRYAHDEENAYAAGENYFPDNMKAKHYYHPTDRGLEAKIKEKLQYLKQLDEEALKTSS